MAFLRSQAFRCSALRSSALRSSALLTSVVILGTRSVVAQDTTRIFLAPPPTDTVSTVITQLIAAARHPDLRRPGFANWQADVLRLYDPSRPMKLLWTVNGTPTPYALDVVAALSNVETRGLVPSDYDVMWLTKQVSELTQRRADAATLARFDLGLSLALMRVASDLRIGRVNPRQVKFDYTVRNKQLDIAGFVLMIQSGASPRNASVDQLLDLIEPPFSHYKFLKQALADVRADTANPKRAQHLRQIELTLERWRWIPDDLGTRFIAVNVPGFELYGFDVSISRDTPQVSMPVVVGKAIRNETPIFGGLMQYIIFRPYWNVPTGILRQETLPKLRRNPGALAAERLEIVDANAPDAPSTTYPPTAANLAKLASGAFRVRQRPGPNNALGRIKFMLPNKYDVYLHDTPAQDGFAQSRRDFSHGCIRVGEPLKLAEFVLASQPEWTPEAIDSAMRVGPESRRLNLATPIKVFVLYGTAFAKSDGTVKYYPDLYKYDTALEKALAQRAP